jgi:hypothetical protein
MPKRLVSTGDTQPICAVRPDGFLERCMDVADEVLSKEVMNPAAGTPCEEAEPADPAPRLVFRRLRLSLAMVVDKSGT